MAEPSLDAAISSSNVLIKRLGAAIRSHEATIGESQHATDHSNALGLAATAAKLLRAQTTKLSLLALNEPYSPGEMSRIIRSLTTECFPALVTASQLAIPASYSAFLSRLLQERISDLLLLLPSLFDQLPRTAGAAKEAVGRQDTLQHTGQIWDSCDALVALARSDSGLRQAAAAEMAKWQEVFEDATSELEEWDRNGADVLGDEDSVSSDGTDKVSVRLQNMHLGAGKDAASSQEGVPQHARLRLVAGTVKSLKMVKLLYPPLIKRRIKSFAQVGGDTKHENLPSRALIKKLDHVIEFGKRATERADLIAESLYTDDRDTATAELIALKAMAMACMKLVEQTWDNQDDEFTKWARQWMQRLEELQTK